MANQMKVTLLAHTPDPEKTVACAAKLCYANSSVDNLYEGLTEEKINSFVEMLAQIGHESPIEHVSFTFAIEGISRACSHQLVRHRIASYSQKSQRYVSEAQFAFVTPPVVAESEETEKLYGETMEMIQKAYEDLRIAILTKYLTTFLEEHGVALPDGAELLTYCKEAYKKEYSALLKKAQEDARFVLPNACETSIIVTMNARSLMNFFKHRCCNRAQWEIKAVADEMLRLVYEVAPTLFQKAGPSCVRGGCPEGKMSCGKISEMRAYYQQKKTK